MGVYDQSARYAVMIEPTFLLQRLRQEVRVELTFRDWFPTRTMPLPGGPDRDADLVAIIQPPGENDPAWLLIFEFQSEHDPEKLGVLSLETMIFFVYARDTERAGSRFLPLPVFVYLRGRNPTPRLALRAPSGKGSSVEPVLWEVEGDSASDTLARVEADETPWIALFWIPLMAGGAAEETVGTWQRLLQTKVPERYRGDVLYIALQFTELVGTTPDWNRVLNQGDLMTESPLANQMIQLGEMRAARAHLLRVIRLRFPELCTPDVERTVADQPSLSLLNEWFEAVCDAEKAEDFLAVLRR